MSVLISRIHSLLVCMALGAVAITGSATAQAADIYDSAVRHAGRSAADLKRDALDHPADVLRLSNIGPGMRVADVLAGDGYYSELLSYIVGSSGHVLLLNNSAYDHWSDNGWQRRLAKLPNVEHRTIELEHLDVPDASLDAALLIKVYHDLYWTDSEGTWPKTDPSKVLDEVARVLKPGAILLVVDHSAKPGTGKSDAGSLHRIDEAYARSDFEAHGFQLVGQSDALRKPEDPREQISYKPPMLGKTDRFVLAFRKRA